MRQNKNAISMKPIFSTGQLSTLIYIEGDILKSVLDLSDEMVMN